MKTHAVQYQTPVNESAPPPAEKLVWRAYPARSRPQAAVAGALLIVAIGALAGWGGGVGLGVGSAAVLLLALSRFFFPSKFTIDEKGVTAQYMLSAPTIAFKDVRRFVHDDHGGYLSTRAKPSRLDAYRGVHILFGDDRAGVIAHIKAAIAGAHEAQDMDNDEAGDNSGSGVNSGGGGNSGGGA